MKTRYLEAVGEIDNMYYFAQQAAENEQVADELGITMRQAAYMAQALEEALEALENGVTDADLVPVEE